MLEQICLDCGEVTADYVKLPTRDVGFFLILCHDCSKKAEPVR